MYHFIALTTYFENQSYLCLTRHEKKLPGSRLGKSVYQNSTQRKTLAYLPVNLSYKILLPRPLLWILFVCFYFFDIGSHAAKDSNLELLAFLSPSPKC